MVGCCARNVRRKVEESRRRVKDVEERGECGGVFGKVEDNVLGREVKEEAEKGFSVIVV